MTTHVIDQDRALEFITAGNCTFSLKSLLTGKHITYTCKLEEKFGVPELIVRYLSGSDNERSYSFLCKIVKREGILKIIKGKNVSEDQTSYKSFKFVFRNLMLSIRMNNLEIWHSGTCCRCGKKLTVPSSIESGYGPECFDKSSKFII